MDRPETTPGPGSGGLDEGPAGFVGRNAALILAVVAAVALVGFLRGVREPAPLHHPAPAEPASHGGAVPPAVRYAELPRARQKPNAGWQSDLTKLGVGRPKPTDPVTRTEAMKLEALTDRARNRAFDGAPPTIPHPVDQVSPASCLACHGAGLKVGDRVATKVSHPRLTNCTQCHAESARPEFGRFSGAAVENSFGGVGRAGPGARAWPGAPPTIPHTTWMRQDCASCHGLVARPGLRTTHPWLTNCTQCHAPSAVLDQVAFPMIREAE